MRYSRLPQPFAKEPAARAWGVTWLPALLLSLAIALGGGSALFPLPRMIVELAAVPVLVLGLRALPAGRIGWRDDVPLLLILVTILLFVAQLVPLPPGMWMALPGREIAADTARQLGWAEHWMPLSLDPEATIRAGLTLIPAIALFLAVLAGDDRDHRRLLLVIAAMAAISLALGVVQALSGWSPAFYLFDSAHQGLPTGVFANRNHQACLLAIAPLAVAAAVGSVSGRHRSASLAAGGVLGLLCILGVLATGSRTGTALLLPVTMAMSLMAVPTTQRRRVSRWAFIVLVVAMILLLAITIGGGALLRRFGQVDDQRFGFWPDVIVAIRTYFPVGSGFGTFEPIFAAAERLTIVGPHYLNHAHSDYLEIALEGGLAAIALVAAFLIWFAARGRRVWWSGPISSARTRAQYAWVALLAVLLHSAIDYPLRTLAIQAVFAVFAGILARAGVDREPEADTYPAKQVDVFNGLPLR